MQRNQFSSSVQSLSCVWLLVTPWTAACQALLSITISQSLLKFSPLSWWCHSTISSSVIPFFFCFQSFSASGSFQMSQFFTSGFSFNISPSNEHPGLISFRIDWYDLLAVQGTLWSLLQHHSSKASILWRQPSSQSNSHIHTEELMLLNCGVGEHSWESLGLYGDPASQS